MNDKLQDEATVKRGRGRPPLEDGLTAYHRIRKRGELQDAVERPVSIRRIIYWVFNSLDNVAVMEKSAPCPGAWSMLQWAKADAASRDLFFKNYVVKLLPSKAQMEAEEAQADDDGKHLAETIKRLLGIADAAQRAGAQGDAGEPGISAEGAGRGAEG